MPRPITSAQRWPWSRREKRPLGIVYQTDATAEPKVKIVDTFPEDTHPPIIYPIAFIGATKNADAAKASSTI